MKHSFRCLLVGNANSGKSTLFNQLTGLSQRTGNFHGVTVEKLHGKVQLGGNQAEVIDLPGSYSLNGFSEDKKVLSRFLMNREENDRILFVMDSLNLERSLQFFFQIMDLGVPLLLVLTMKDVLKKKKMSLELEILKEKLGVDVFLVNAKNGDGVKELKEALFREGTFRIPVRTWSWESKKEEFVNHLKDKIQFEKTDIHFILENALKELSGETLQPELPGLELFPENIQSFLKEELEKSGFKFTYQDELVQKSFFAKKIVTEVLLFEGDSIGARRSFSNQIDRYVLHPVFGFIIFIFLMGFIFQTLFSWSELPANLIEKLVNFMADFARSRLPEGPLSELIAEGIIGGVGSVLTFIPQISFLFLFIGIMEESGYMARAALVMDKLMGKFGLSGKSFIPLLSSAACAVPGILSARTVENRSERLATILVAPLVTCSARYPVYILVIGTIFPVGNVLGFLSIQGLALFLLFSLGLITSLSFALLFKKTFFKSDPSYFITEIPSYQIPSLRNLGLNLYKNLRAFVVNAGTIILYISIILWFLANYPNMEKPDLSRLKSPEEKSEVMQDFKKRKITNSYAGQFGRFIEPVILPLGFDWKIGISLLTSFAAREVMVSTLSIIYGVEDGEENNQGLKSKMLKDYNPLIKKKTWNFLTGISILLFFAFACQCISTLAVVRKETNSYIWPGFLFVYMTTLAYLSSLVVFQTGRLIGF